ncbi:MAG: cytochrome c [Vicinamibacterales bacterium]|jgi:cytochrome c|nr:hypothetical protein [Acidobacteriota bacterium]MDP6610301.1 cytochrome c [Vicinamibacterales bacterium]MBU24397.1 hypothetical protein [Acidobacteriota bacterium]MDP7295257.1 cytochrome c [Vicinamibacterales bacterium]MDP7480064.1 cytochrome c [Vicinamibacterales bacterium]|tara:strand:- start:1616 stop:2200 length:585 start_codon:yes stop_codon:yes gene_type:complete
MRVATPRSAGVWTAVAVVIVASAAIAAQQDQPERFGFGRPATEAEIAAWDIDVTPDGTGLPPGGGTAVEGRSIYVEKCEICHGAHGEGRPFSQLVGREPRQGFPFGNQPSLVRTIGNYWPFAPTLYDYTFRTMPFDEPGTLEPDEVYALTAFLLYLNDIVAEDDVIDANTLPRVQMPARDKFVGDNRRGGRELR